MEQRARRRSTAGKTGRAAPNSGRKNVGKNAFKNAYKRRRCLIPADGFYEWKLNPDGKSKQPMYIRLKGGEPFALAGLWEYWADDKGNELRTADPQCCPSSEPWLRTLTSPTPFTAGAASLS